MRSDLASKIRAFILEEKIFSAGDAVLCGVSGGADSICLLSVLMELSGELSITLRAVHVEHGIRGEESRGDAAFVKRFCEERGVPVKAVSVDAPAYAREHGVSLEEAARVLRYQVFATELAPESPNDLPAPSFSLWNEATAPSDSAKLAVAHHADDNAETILFQMLRGTGYRGVYGMAPVRGRICRPLLCVPREEIEEYVRAQGLPFRTDSTNACTDHARNRLRAEVMPILKELNPRAVEHINRSAYLVRRLSTEHEEIVNALLKCYMDEEGGLLRKPVSELSADDQREILHAWLRHVSPSQRDIGAVHIEAVRGLLSGPSNRSVDLPHKTTVRAEKRRLLFGMQNEEKIYKKLYSTPKLC